MRSLAPNSHISALVRKETTCSTLLAALIELDPQPLLSSLNIASPGGPLTVVRELGVDGGRIDIAVLSGSTHLIWIELKVGSTQHGHQFTNYEIAADGLLLESGKPAEDSDLEVSAVQKTPVRLLCVAPELDAPREIAAKSERWSFLSLSDFVSLWLGNAAAPEASMLASLIKESSDYLQSAQTRLFNEGMHVTDLRVMANVLHEQVRSRVETTNAQLGSTLYYAYKKRSDRAGRPSIFIAKCVDAEKDIWAVVDARSVMIGASTVSGASGQWQFRVGVVTESSPANREKFTSEQRKAFAVEAMTAVQNDLTAGFLAVATGGESPFTAQNEGFRKGGGFYTGGKGLWVTKLFMLDATGLDVEGLEKLLFDALDATHRLL